MVKEKMIFSDFQESTWRRLSRIKLNDRIGSAYCFSGNKGSAKEYGAIEFAKLLNCESVKGTFCDKCKSCFKFKSLQHPNLKIIIPLPSGSKSNKDNGPLDSLKKEELQFLTESIIKKGEDPFYKITIPNARRITISSIRDLRRSIYLKSQTFGRKIILIFDAHLLSEGAGESANALLKLLEEPPDNTTLILVTDKSSALLPTIMSRCQIINFPSLNFEIVQNFLEDEGINNQEAILLAALSRGDIHLARKFSKLTAVNGIFTEMESSVKQITKVNENGWRKFIDSYSLLATRKPEEFKFKIYLLQLWFNIAYSHRVQNNSSLNFQFLLESIIEFNRAYPNANLFEINKVLEETTESLSRNYYTPLTLTNLLISIQRLLKGKELLHIS